MVCPSCSHENEAGVEVCFHCGQSLFALTRGAVLAGRYEIRELIGRGGMGMVYAANDRALDERVALKVLRPELVESPEIARRLRSEIKLARRIRHRNVCAIHEYGEHGSLQFLVMEMVEGVDLRKILEERGPSSPEEGYAVALEVAAGLQAIHEAGVIHRDLKTPNIMRDASGRVVLMDFGIAKNTQGRGNTVGTATGDVVGTPEYMSPEQGTGQKLDHRSDLYALGIVVYELFSGRVPFREETPLATIFKQIEAPPPLDDVPGLPDELKPVLARALAKAPADRFESAAAMGAALRAARDGSAGESGATRPAAIETIALQGTGNAEPVSTGAPGVAVRPQSESIPVTRGLRSVAPEPARSRARSAILVGVLIVGAAGIWALSQRPTSVPEPDLAAAQEAPEQSRASAREPIAAEPPEPGSDALASDGDGRAEAAPAQTPTSTPAPPPPTPVAQAAPALPSPEPDLGEPLAATPAPAPGVGRLQLRIVPWAEIDLDGKRIGTTPMAPLELPEGVYEVLLHHPSYRPLKKRVTIRGDETFLLDVDLSFEAFPDSEGKQNEGER